MTNLIYTLQLEMIHKVLRLHPFLAMGVLCYAFLTSALIINIIQFLIYLFIRPFSFQLGVKLNGLLCSTHFAFFTFVAEWHCECNIRFWYEKEDVLYHDQEHTLCICNHSGEVDWLFGYTLLERINSLKGCKGVVKSEISYLPTLGWMMALSDYLWLSRDWTKDKSSIASTCRTWARYEKTEANFYILYAEGTRFTEAKHASSVKYCKEKGIEPFRNVLMPRTKGAAEIITQLGDSLGSIQDVIFAFPGSNTPNTSTMFAGTSTDVDIYFRRIPLSKVPTEDKDQISDYIVKQFREKDDLLEYHKEHDTFPGTPTRLPKRRRSLYFVYFWSTVTLTPLFYFLYSLVRDGNVLALSCIAALMVLGGLIANRLINAAVLQHASKYGLSKDQLAKASKAG